MTQPRVFPDGHFGPNHLGVVEVILLALSDDCFCQPAPVTSPQPGMRIVAAPARPEATAVEVELGLVLDWLDLLEYERADYITPSDPAIEGDEASSLVYERIAEFLTEIE